MTPLHRVLAGGPADGLRDMKGPSAYGDDRRRFLRLLWRMARTQFAIRYHGSVLGYGWSLLSPLLLFGVLYFAFTEIIPFGDSIPHYPVVLLVGIVLFQFFSDGVGQGLYSIVHQESVVRKLEFPRLVIPLSAVLVACFSLFLNVPIALGYVILSGVEVTVDWLLLPLLLLYLLVLTTGLALLMSSLYVRFRDTAQIWSVFNRLLFYASPIIWTIELFPEDLEWILPLNPLVPVLVQARTWVIDPDAPGFAETMGSASYILIPIGITVGIFALGLWVFARQAPHVAEEL